MISGISVLSDKFREQTPINIKTANFLPAKSIKTSDCFISKNNINKARFRGLSNIPNILNVSKPAKISFGETTDLSGFYKIGEILLIDRTTGREVPAQIMSDLKPNDCVQNYCIAIRDKKLGYMTIEHVDEPYEISNNVAKKGYIRIINLNTKDKNKDKDNNIYKGVGAGLVYVALRQSFEAYDGRIKLQAYKLGKVAPIKFYKDLGFIPDQNGIIDVKSNIYMHIPEGNIEKWKGIIEKMNARAKIDQEHTYDKALSYPILKVLSIPALFSALRGQFSGL